jgi:hypothetical protein
MAGGGDCGAAFPATGPDGAGVMVTTPSAAVCSSAGDAHPEPTASNHASASTPFTTPRILSPSSVPDSTLPRARQPGSGSTASGKILSATGNARGGSRMRAPGLR